MNATDTQALALPEQLVDIRTGELVPATAENAAELIVAVREWRSRALDLVKDCEAVLLDASRREGTKTLHLEGATATITGGKELTWDLDALSALCVLGLPEARFNELVVATVTYRVDARVAKQLEAANPEYARVIQSARSYAEKPWRVSIRTQP